MSPDEIQSADARQRELALLRDLTTAVAAEPCPLCEYIEKLEDVRARTAMREAAAGTIGINRLSKILQNHRTGIGRRTIERHRREGHTP